MSKFKSQWWQLLLWVIGFQLVGYTIGLLTQTNIGTWYQSINRSPLTPPNIVFPIVWGLLYVLLAIVAWLLFQQRQSSRGRVVLYLYLVQMLLNWSWTPIFFNLHWVWLGFVWIVAIIILTVLVVIKSCKATSMATYLLLPYIVWLLFAAYLNLYICLFN